MSEPVEPRPPVDQVDQIDRLDQLDRRIAGLPPRLRWAAGALRLTLREPADGLDRVLVRAHALVARGRPVAHEYAVDADWHARLHERLRWPWPCACAPAFERLWAEVAQELRDNGLAPGRSTYGGWDDADPGLARAIWCLINHLRPDRVVETGVAHGVTSRVILEAMQGAQTGHLWSIDLPAMDPSLHAQIGVAVPGRLRSRWTYIAGTSRRRLPRLLGEIAPIGLFVHDSSHTERNMRFELRTAWPAVSGDGGAIVADDVQQSAAFERFVAAAGPASWYVAGADDGGSMFGVALRTP